MAKYRPTMSDRDGYFYGELERDFVGAKYRHHKQPTRAYHVSGIVYMGETDQWGIRHYRDDCETVFVRSAANFFGKNDAGEPRFTRLD